MPHSQNYRFWRVVAQCLSGSIALALVTLVCFRLRLNVGTTACLYLIIIVLLSLQGSFLSSAVVSLIAVGCLAYYFAPPIFSFRISDPFDGAAVLAFLLTSAVITHLVSRVRIRTEQLVLTNAKLEAEIIERKQMQESLQQAQANLARVNRVMLVGEMTASIAHEVNQPIAAAITNASAGLRWLAAQPPDMEEARQVLGRIVRDGNRASEVIARVRGLVKKVPVRRDLLDINEAIVEVTALTHSELHSNRVKLHTHLSRDLPLIPVDRVQLQQVILNLIVNAIEAMSGVGDRPRELAVGSGGGDSNDVFVEVRDSGQGLDPADLDRLFGSFYTTKPDGMGMGLAISRSIVEAHGGRLWATPNEPHGAVFRFTLPVEEGAPADPAPSLSQRQ
jgi:C4-dicarboxylate-specific signal transduction histidine kinase